MAKARRWTRGRSLGYKTAMKRWLLLPSVQITLCLLVYGLVVWRMGPFAAVILSPLLAAAVARPVLNLIANFRHGVRAHVWVPAHGQHYVFKGITIHVQEDDDYCRWVNLADVRKVVGMTATDRVLAAAYPGRVQATGRPPRTWLRDDALVEHLAKENDPTALRLRTWVERTIMLPGRRVQQNRGVRMSAAPASADDD